MRDVRTGHGEDLERVLTSQGLPLGRKCHDVVAVEAGVRAEVVALMGIEGRADRPDLGQWGQGGRDDRDNDRPDRHHDESQGPPGSWGRFHRGELRAVLDLVLLFCRGHQRQCRDDAGNEHRGERHRRHRRTLRQHQPDDENHHGRNQTRRRHERGHQQAGDQRSVGTEKDRRCDRLGVDRGRHDRPHDDPKTLDQAAEETRDSDLAVLVRDGHRPEYETADDGGDQADESAEPALNALTTGGSQGVTHTAQHDDGE